MEFTTNGKVYTCCPAWIKLPIGNIKEQTIAEIWNSQQAIFIRKKMYLGEWQDICNPICPRISVFKNNHELFEYEHINTLDYLSLQIVSEIRSKKNYLNSFPTVFNLSNSRVCNLSCIMCDRKQQDDDPYLIEKTAKDLYSYLPAAKKLILTGLGDPLARPDIKNLLVNVKGHDFDLKIDLITNGLLLPRYWDEIKHWKFDTLLISIDAAKKETYENIRIGASWEVLLESLSLVRENKDRFNSVTINMTVMRNNYEEIPQFIEFAQYYGFNVSFQRIRGHWGDQNFFEMNDSSELKKLSAIIDEENIQKRHINIFWGDLLEYITQS
jgi:MoaA/NifB/PqqE/SkfB family radical SAM enzyme